MRLGGSQRREESEQRQHQGSVLAANTRAGRGEAHAGNIMGSTGEVTISKRLWQEMKHQEGRVRRKGKPQMLKM